MTGKQESPRRGLRMAGTIASLTSDSSYVRRARTRDVDRILEVISTYVYKVGLAGGVANFSYAAAIGLFNSVLGLILLVAANQAESWARL